MDGGVAALGRADGPRAAGVAGLGDQRVVPALAVGRADRVDGRQVDHVEAHVGRGGQALGGADEAALGPGEQLVPGAEARPGPVDPQRQLRRGQIGVGQRGDDLADLVVEPGVEPHLKAAAVPAQGRRRVEDPLTLLHPVPQLGGGRLQQPGALLQLEGHVVADRDLDLDVVAPGGEPVPPGLDHQLVAADTVRLEHGLPMVLVHLPHGDGLPVPRLLGSPAQPGRQDVVAVGVDVRPDGHGLPHHGLGGEGTRRRGRGQVLDGDAVERSY